MNGKYRIGLFVPKVLKPQCFRKLKPFRLYYFNVEKRIVIDIKELCEMYGLKRIGLKSLDGYFGESGLIK